MKDKHQAYSISPAEEHNVRLENEKLAAEIREINLRITNSQREARREIWKATPTYLGIFITLVLGTPAAIYQLHQFVEQQRAEQVFAISSEMIRLVSQLNDPEEKSELRRAAAISLALLGDPAIPLLIDNLDVVNNIEVEEAVIGALESILLRKNDPDDVLEPTRKAADRVIRREATSANPRALPVKAYSKAVARLAAAARERLDGAEWDDARTHTIESLTNFQNVVQNSNFTDNEENELGAFFEGQIAAVPD